MIITVVENPFIYWDDTDPQKKVLDEFGTIIGYVYSDGSIQSSPEQSQTQILIAAEIARNFQQQVFQNPQYYQQIGQLVRNNSQINAGGNLVPRSDLPKDFYHNAIDKLNGVGTKSQSKKLLEFFKKSENPTLGNTNSAKISWYKKPIYILAMVVCFIIVSVFFVVKIIRRYMKEQ